MKEITNRILKLTILLLLFSSCTESKIKQNESIDVQFEWKTTPENNQGFKASLDSLITSVKNGDYGYIDEIFVSTNDSIQYQEFFNLDYNILSRDISGKLGCGINACKDSSEINIYNYYHPKFHPYYLQSKLHTLQSITKSVTSTIVGTALENKKLVGLDESILPYFENYSLSKEMRTHLEATSLKDILTMQLGLEWKEFGMSLEEESSVGAMELSDDWIEYVLKQDIVAKPGEAWNYNSGASQLLSQIIREATEINIDEYASQELFKKLNIQNHFWKKTVTGLPDTEGGLYLKSEDLAKIGLLHLNNGIWNGERILPENWVKEALGKQVTDIYNDGGTEGYGYQWWITADEAPLAVGLGYGNQIMVIIPEKKIVGIVFAWNVMDNKAKYIFRDFVEVLLKL